MRILLDPQGGEGGNGDAPNTEAKGGDKAPDLATKVENLIAKHGDAASVVRVLLSENHTYRDTIRDLKTRLPADGSLVLTGDDAKAWAAYRQLGDPSTVGKALEERATLAGQMEEYRLKEDARDAGKLLGLNGDAVFKLLKGDKATLRIDREAKGKDGKAEPAVYVVARGEDGKPTEIPYAAYAEANWTEFAPALKPSGPAPVGPVRQVATPNGHAPAPSERERIPVRLPRL